MLTFNKKMFLSVLTVALFVARAITLSDSIDSSSLSPRFVSQPTNYSVVKGEDVIIECTITDLDESDTVLWRTNQSGSTSTVAIGGAVAGNRRDKYTVSVDESRQNHHLVIKDVSVDDEGTFICEVFGDDPVIQQHHLTVNIPPTVTVLPAGFLSVNVGDPILLTCEAEGKPEPKVTWRKTGSDFSYSGNTLMVDNSTVNDAGEYFCSADNGIGMSPATAFIEVLVQYPPTVDIVDGVLYTEVGRTARVDIVCTFDGMPPVEVIWKHNDNPVNFRDRPRLTYKRTYKGDYVLTISGVQVEDLGEYQCIGGNSLGQDTGVVLVKAEPYNLEVTSDVKGSYSNQYKLVWAVNSHNPLVEFDLKLNGMNVSDNETEPMSNTIPAPRHHSLRHTQYYIIKDLESDTEYRIRLRARNTYGYSDWIEFIFRTNLAGLTAPPNSDLSTDVPSPKSRQQQTLQGNDNSSAENTVFVSPHLGEAGSTGNLAAEFSLNLVTVVIIRTILEIV